MEMKRRRRRDYSSLRMIDSAEQNCGYPCVQIWLKEVTNTRIYSSTVELTQALCHRKRDDRMKQDLI